MENLAVVDEHVAHIVQVLRIQVWGFADEAYERTVRRDDRWPAEVKELSRGLLVPAAVPVPLGTAGGEADTLGRSSLPVADEHVDDIVCVVWDQVPGVAREDHKAAVAR